jgi:hypothetical protein
LCEHGVVVEGTDDDLDAVQILKRPFGLVSVTDQNASLFACGLQMPDNTSPGPTGRASNEKRHVVP